jgi:hypothetical protein
MIRGIEYKGMVPDSRAPLTSTKDSYKPGFGDAEVNPIGLDIRLEECLIRLKIV